MRISGQKILVFHKILRTYKMSDSKENGKRGVLTDFTIFLQTLIGLRLEVTTRNVFMFTFFLLTL